MPDLPHHHEGLVVRLCGALSRMPGIGHSRADRLQEALLSPWARDIRAGLWNVFKSLFPLFDQMDAFHRLAAAIRKSAGDSTHSYQTTLRRWLEETDQSK